MVRDTPSIRYTNSICIKPFDLKPISSPLPPTNPSHLHAFDESLGDIRRYNPSFDRYCAYLEVMSKKIMLSTFFDHAFDYSMAFGKFKRGLTSFVSSSIVFPYSHHCEMHVVTFDKLLRALTAS